MTPTVIVVMGVSGAGKSTIGEALAARLDCPFQDADALHPRANILKMAAGHPLDDADRAPWLQILHDWIAAQLNTGQPAVLAASLLKRAYRDQVGAGDPRVALVYLHGDPEVLRARMNHRHGHFMPAHMLDSQLETLEPPDASEGMIEVDVGGSVEQTVARVSEGLNARLGGLPAARDGTQRLPQMS